MSTVHPQFLLLIVSLPANSATARMRIWRAVKSLGCVPLRDGAYLIPHSDERSTQISQLAADTNREGGTGWVLNVTSVSQAEHDVYATLFNRSPEYEELLATLGKARQLMPALSIAEQGKSVRKLRKEYEAIKAIDFFPGDLSARADEAWTQFFHYAEGLIGAEPRSVSISIIRATPRDYQNRTWATRRRPWVDRVASAWLIHRFVDPDATFLWLDSPSDCPSDALGFDFDGAAFTHVGELVTFEVLMASFGLDKDIGLVQLGQMVHFLDVGGAPVAAAAGFEAMLDGARARMEDDDQLLAEMSTILDSLYVHFSRTKGEMT